MTFHKLDLCELRNLCTFWPNQTFCAKCCRKHRMNSQLMYVWIHFYRFCSSISDFSTFSAYNFCHINFMLVVFSSSHFYLCYQHSQNHYQVRNIHTAWFALLMPTIRKHRIFSQHNNSGFDEEISVHKMLWKNKTASAPFHSTMKANEITACEFSIQVNKYGMWKSRTDRRL